MVNRVVGTRGRGLRLGAWIGSAGVLFFGQVIWLWLLRGRFLLEREGVLIWGQVGLGVAAIGIWGLLKTTPVDAIRLPGRASALLVVGGTAVLQGLAVWWLAPVLSDDLFRYRLDGRMWLSGVSPYAVSPAEFEAARVAEDAGDALVPYRDWRTVYPPVSQAVFAGARWVEDRVLGRGEAVASSLAPLAWRERVAGPAVRTRTVVFRATFGLMSVLAVGVLVARLRRDGESPWWVVPVAWNPLLTLEVGGMGHQDSVGMFLVAVVLWAVGRRWFGVAAVGLGLACGVKPVAGLLLPFLWRACHEAESFRAGRRMVGVFLVTVVVVFVPALVYQRGWVGWGETLGRFGRTWEANGLVYETVKWVAGAGDQGRQMERAKDAARLLATLAVLGAGLVLWQWRARVAEAGYGLFLVLLLCAPVAYPWYLVWVLAVVPVMRSGVWGVSGLVWAATAGLSYTIWRDAGWVWRVPTPYLVGEYAPVLVAVAVEVLVGLRSKSPTDQGRNVFLALPLKR